MSDRKSGVVKWFSKDKGFGFITPDGGGKDLFVHYTGIDGTGRRDLFELQKVSFDVVETEKGSAAANVKAI